MKLVERYIRICLGILAGILVIAAATFAESGSGSLRGKVIDIQGALIAGASVTAIGADGVSHAIEADRNGEFVIQKLGPGKYRVVVSATGFAGYENPDVVVAPGKATALDVTMSITVSENVTVGGDEPINTDPNANSNAIVLKGEDFKALPDNPADLEAALQALAGPAAGPAGGEIFIDGFSGGKLPPRDSIREIRINQNPFSSEYDRPGFGRIEVFTKPGSDKWRGEIGSEFEDESFNSRNPFAANRPPFQLRNINGNFGGPIIKKRTSFFVDVEKEDIDNNALINAQVLNADLAVVPFQKSIVSPLKTYEFNTRVDHQISQNNTLIVRFLGSGAKTTNAGLNGFDLATRAYNATDSDSTLRISDTAVISPTIINDASFQYIRRRTSQSSTDLSSTIRVLDAFTGGGANVGLAFNNEDRLEFQDFMTVVHGNHLLKFGVRARQVKIFDVSPNNFAGTFTFTSLDQYRNTILRLPGAHPDQFIIAGGNPDAQVKRFDIGVFVQDDWKIRPNFTISAGLRYEAQTNISDHADLAPRFSFAFAPGNKGTGKPKLVFRGGFGVFYDRFSESLTLQSIRFNGLNQQQFVVTDPAILSQAIFTVDGRVSNVPTAQTLAAFAQPQTIRIVASDLQAPRTSQLALSVERQLPFNTTVSATYIFSHTDHLLRSRYVNAPIGGSPQSPGAGNIFQYESTARVNQNQLLFNFRSNFNKRMSVFGNYAFGAAKSDSDGAGTFPADQYFLNDEYGNASTDIRHRFVIGGNIKAPFGISVSPFITYRSGIPFNITTGRDNNGDTLFTDRPSFAASAAESGIIVTRFGAFDPTPEPGDTIIPRNYGRGPSFFVANLRLAKEIGFGGGKKTSGAAAPSGDDRNRTGTNNPFGGGSAPSRAGRDDDESPYKLELSVQIRNIFNTTNGGTPVGNLSSPLFGQPVSLASGFGFGGGRQSGGNRRLRFELNFSF